MRIIAFLLLITFFTQSACQNAGEEQLVADYKIRYITEQNAFEAKAKYVKYKENGDKKAAEQYFPETGVNMSGKPMEMYKIQNTPAGYTFKKTMFFPEEKIKFGFQDLKGQPIEHHVNFQPLQNVHVEHDYIQIDSGFYLIWEGQPLVPTEELLLTFDYGNEVLLQTSIMGKTESNRFFIRPEQLTTLRAGVAKILFLQKIYTTYPEDSPVRGSYFIEYYHQPIKVQVE